MAKNRPLTQKEIKAKRAKNKVQNKETVTIQNVSAQLIVINIRQSKGLDFYIHSRDIHIKPGASVKLPTDKLWSTQLDRLRKRRMITVIVNADKEMAAKKISDARDKRAAMKAEKVKVKAKAIKAKTKVKAKPSVKVVEASSADVKQKSKTKSKAKPAEESPPDNPENG